MGIHGNKSMKGHFDFWRMVGKKHRADVSKVVSKLRYKVKDRRKLGDMHETRHEKLRKIVTGLFKHERIETSHLKADECRGYAERLISDAIRYGDCHKQTMELANYWLIEKQLVHKLFKVLAPRYENVTTAYTRLWRLPKDSEHQITKCVLELRNNIYPSLAPETAFSSKMIHNVLLDEARKEFRKAKYGGSVLNAGFESSSPNKSAETVENSTKEIAEQQSETELTQALENLDLADKKAPENTKQAIFSGKKDRHGERKDSCCQHEGN